MLFWKKRAKKEIIIDEEYIEVLRLKRNYGKLIKVVNNELKKGNQAGYLYSALADALEHTSKKPDYSKLIDLYTRAIESNPDSSVLHYQRAKCYILLKKYQDAEKDLLVCNKLTPNDSASIIELGNVELKLNKLDKAIELFDRALLSNPNSAEAFMGRSDAKLQKGLIYDAISDLSYAMGLMQDSERMFIRRGELNLAAERYSDAIKDFTAALKFNPKNIKVYEKRAQAYLAKKNYSYAIADYEQILNIDKRDINAMIESAKILHKYVRSSNAAMILLDRAAKVKPTNPDIYKVRAYIKADINDLKGSMADFNTAIKYCGNDNKNIAEIFSMRGELYYKQGFYEEAIKDYNVMIDKWPNVPDLYKKRANALKETENYGAAVKDYSYIIRLVPDELDNYFTLALLYIERMKNNSMGLKVIEKAVDRFKKSSSDVYQLKGEILLKMGKFNEAIDSFLIALEINPKSIEALYFKGNAEYKMGDVDAAIADYSKIIELDADFYKAYNKRAFCYVQKHQFNLAIGDYTNAIRLNPDLSSAIVNRAKCKEIMKDYEGALADYTTAITLNPKNLDIYYLRGNLKQLLGDSAGALDDFSKTLRDDSE